MIDYEEPAEGSVCWIFFSAFALLVHVHAGQMCLGTGNRVVRAAIPWRKRGNELLVGLL